MKLLAWCIALLVLVGVATGLDRADGDRSQPLDRRGPGGGAQVELAGLRSFDGCGELLDWFRETARTSDLGGFAVAEAGQRVTTDAAVGGGDDLAVAGGEAADSAAAPTAADGGFSGTNVQELDVDEPDIVKTDGDLIVTVAPGELNVLDPAPEGVRLLATLALPDGSPEVLLSGDRALVLTRAWVERAPTGPEPGVRGTAEMVVGRSVTVLTGVDLGDPGAPRVLDTRTLDGDYVSARMVGTTARVVLRSSPDLGQPEPAPTSGADATEDVEAWLDEAIDEAPLERWLPTDGETPLVACDAVSRPAEPAGVGTVTVLTLDVTGSLEPLDATAVVADAHTVYASTDRLYVATTSWAGCCSGGAPMPIEDDEGKGDTAVSSADALPAVTTDLHVFDTTGPTTPYVGSGRVEGRLLNSFALSEHEGILRVATTIDAVEPSGSSESMVLTLAEEGGALVERGRLAGLGTTEQIYAVRYQGDVGYVVTFRQTDPLYTIDLSDPAAPRRLGELKIPGYSAYLHPAEQGRLIGVGQDATEEGRTQGAQVSTFDVSDLTAPAEEDRLSFPDSTSPVEYDHKAFLWWPAQRVAVVPLETWTFDTAGRDTKPVLGAVAVDVGTDGQLQERGRVTHQDKVGPDAYPSILRSLVIGDALYTLSDGGLLASDLATLAEEGWVAL